MSCKQWQRHLVALTEDVLSSHRKSRLELHLQICPRCREALRQLQASHHVLTRVPPADLPATLDIWPQLQSTLQRASSRRERAALRLHQVWEMPVVRFASALVLVVGLVCLGNLNDWLRQEEPVPQTDATVYLLEETPLASDEHTSEKPRFLLGNIDGLGDMSGDFLLPSVQLATDPTAQTQF